MFELLPLLAAAGDVGIWVLVALFWHMDRRIFKLELAVFPDAVKRRRFRDN